MSAVLEATPETLTPFIAITENKITRKPLVQAVIDTQEVAKAIDARDFNKAMSLRDTEFLDVYNSYMTTTSTGLDEKMKLPDKKVCFFQRFPYHANIYSICVSLSSIVVLLQAE